MPRPERIEYAYACYHVMNRGRGRQAIFHDKRYYQAFLQSLEESYQRFNAVIHAYCLMGNHYHLLITTPNSNLSRIMRHINGTYTQRYNRLKHIDGPLFKGRYQAILIQADAYLLQVSRYIHRNPMDMKTPLVKSLEDYPWSSYPCYLGQRETPAWLYQDDIYHLMGQKQNSTAYQYFVEQGNGEALLKHYQRGNTPAVIGEPGFRSEIYTDQLPQYKKGKRGRLMQHPYEMQAIVTAVANEFKASEERIKQGQKGPGTKRCDARRIAMYLCQEIADYRLQDIARYFHLNHPGSVSYGVSTLRKEIASDEKLQRKINRVIKHLL